MNWMRLSKWRRERGFGTRLLSMISIMLIIVLPGCGNKEQTYYTDTMNAINPKAPVRTLNILIDGKHFRLSSEYASLAGAWDPEKQAFIGYLGFEFDGDTFLPFKRTSKKYVWGKIEVRSAKRWGGEPELSMRLSDDPQFSYRHIVRAPERDKFGLTAYITREKDWPNEILVSQLVNGDVYFLECYPEGLFPNPVCTNRLIYNGLQLEIAFNKSLLPQWREIHEKAISKISAFIVSESQK